MPLKYAVSRPQRLGLFQYSGRFVLSDVGSCIKAHLRDPAFSADQNQLVDLTAVTHFDLDFDSVATIVASQEGLLDQFDADLRRIIIAKSELGYGMARMYQQISKDRLRTNVRVCRDLSEAWAMLGVPPEEGEKILRDAR